MVYSIHHLRKGADKNLKDSSRKLRGRIVEKFGTTGAFAKAIKCSRQSVYNKLNHTTDMSRNDMEVWMKALEIPQSEVCEYFF